MYSVSLIITLWTFSFLYTFFRFRSDSTWVARSVFVLGKFRNVRQMSVLYSLVLKWKSLKRQCLSQVRNKLCASEEDCSRWGLYFVCVKKFLLSEMCITCTWRNLWQVKSVLRVCEEVCGRWEACYMSVEFSSTWGVYYVCMNKFFLATHISKCIYFFPVFNSKLPTA